MVTHVFDISNLSQEIFAIDTFGTVICSLGHGHKHMLITILPIWRPGFKLLDVIASCTQLSLKMTWLLHAMSSD